MDDDYEKLISAIAANDDEALTTFYNLTVDRTYSLARRITGTPEMAEEVVSDVYLQVWEQAASFSKQKGKVMTWLLMMCRSRALDAIRRVKYMKQWLEYDEESDETLTDHFEDREPYDLLVVLDYETEIHSALMQLKESQRQLISLAYFRGYSHQQLSDFMGIPLGTVKSEIRQAKQILSRFINPLCQLSEVH